MEFDERSSTATVQTPPLIRGFEDLCEDGTFDPESAIPLAWMTDHDKIRADFQFGGMDWRLACSKDGDGVTYQLTALPPEGQHLSQAVELSGSVRIT